MKHFWNERFSSNDYLYGEEPNLKFKEFIDTNNPGRILLPGEGEGRNAVYAAKNGWVVNAIDQSKTGRDKAFLLAKKNEVKIDYVLGDLLKHDYKKESYDAIALVFLHLPPELRIQVHHHLIKLLKPKGKLYILGFTTDQLSYNSGGPKNIEMLYTKEALNKDFNQLNIVKNKYLVSSLTEGLGHDGEASLIEFEAVNEN